MIFAPLCPEKTNILSLHTATGKLQQEGGISPLCSICKTGMHTLHLQAALVGSAPSTSHEVLPLPNMLALCPGGQLSTYRLTCVIRHKSPIGNRLLAELAHGVQRTETACFQHAQSQNCRAGRDLRGSPMHPCPKAAPYSISSLEGKNLH